MYDVPIQKLMDMFLYRTIQYQGKTGQKLWNPSETDSAISTFKTRSRNTEIDEDKQCVIRVGAMLLANWSVDAGELNKTKACFQNRTLHSVAAFNNRRRQVGDTDILLVALGLLSNVWLDEHFYSAYITLRAD
jgi:hypothetical protein